MNSTTSTTPALTKGALVRVYQKPLSEEQLEGIARLVKCEIEGDDEGGSYWMVRFIGRSGRAEVESYPRWVHARHLQS